jgi:hypothetical protein
MVFAWSDDLGGGFQAVCLRENDLFDLRCIDLQSSVELGNKKTVLAARFDVSRKLRIELNQSARDAIQIVNLNFSIAVSTCRGVSSAQWEIVIIKLQIVRGDVGSGVALASKVVETADRVGTTTDFFTDGAVVDRLACTVTGTADIRAAGVVEVEEQAGGQAHGLDGDELVGHQTAEHATDDGEGHVGEAADVAAASAAERVDLLEDLRCLVLQEAGHVFTVYTAKAAKQTGPVPLVNHGLVRRSKVPLTDPFRQLIKGKFRHIILSFRIS